MSSKVKKQILSNLVGAKYNTNISIKLTYNSKVI